MRKTTILHLAPTVSQGGTERVLLDVTSHTPEYRHIVATYLKGPECFTFPDSVKVYRAGLVNPWDAPRRRPIRLAMHALVGFKILAIMAWHRPNIVIGWLHPSFPLSVLGRLFGAKVIWSNHCPSLETLRGDDLARASRSVTARGRFHRLAHAIHHVDEKSRAWHETLGYPNSKGIIIQNGIDLNTFNINVTRTNDVSPTFTFVYPARYDTFQKDHACLFKAAMLLKSRGRDFMVLCVGRDTDRDEFRYAIKDHGIEDIVRGMGPSVAAEMPGVYASVDALVVSSFFESCGLIIPEAMACGLPVVSTDVGIAAKIIGPCGIVVPVRDPFALADAMQRIIDEPFGETALVLGPERAKAYASLPSMISGWKDMIDGLMATRKQKLGLPVAATIARPRGQ